MRHNKETVPGDVEKIITNGTSAGGAMSALMGATGNHPDYEPYLEALGAAKERDDIFAASCYCPIINLENADIAYEWEFNGLWDCHRHKKVEPQNPGEKEIYVPTVDTMSKEQMQMSTELKALFPAYVESLNIKGEDGQKVTLTENGGSLQDFVCKLVCQSAQKAMDSGEDISSLNWLRVEDGVVRAVDYREYIKFRTRMKDTPAFDSVWMGTPENELFGNTDEPFRHFTAYGVTHSKKNGNMAEAKQIKMMNPMEYVSDASATTAKHFRIRHGAVDRDTSLFISALFTLKLRETGVNVDLAYPWGKWHMGDYDSDELFTWIDGVCKARKA